MYNNPFIKLVWYDIWEALKKKKMFYICKFVHLIQGREWSLRLAEWSLRLISQLLGIKPHPVKYDGITVPPWSPLGIINVAESIYQLFNLLLWQSCNLTTSLSSCWELDGRGINWHKQSIWFRIFFYHKVASKPYNERAREQWARHSCPTWVRRLLQGLHQGRETKELGEELILESCSLQSSFSHSRFA